MTERFNNFNNRNAQTTEQKRYILDRLMVVWMLHPNLRLGQLLANCFRQTDLWFFIEDSLLIRRIETFYENPANETESKSPLYQFMKNLLKVGMENEEIVRLGYTFAYNAQFEAGEMSITARMFNATIEVRAIANELGITPDHQKV